MTSARLTSSASIRSRAQRGLVLGAAALALLGLSACGTSETTAAPTTTDGTATSAAPAETTPAETTPAGTTPADSTPAASADPGQLKERQDLTETPVDQLLIPASWKGTALATGGGGKGSGVLWASENLVEKTDSMSAAQVMEQRVFQESMASYDAGQGWTPSYEGDCTGTATTSGDVVTCDLTGSDGSRRAAVISLSPSLSPDYSTLILQFEGEGGARIELPAGVPVSEFEAYDIDSPSQLTEDMAEDVAVNAVISAFQSDGDFESHVSQVRVLNGGESFLVHVEGSGRAGDFDNWYWGNAVQGDDGVNYVVSEMPQQADGWIPAQR